MTRKADYPILDLILNRHSPRAMSGEDIELDVLYSLFEAARWAPSSYNAQPWRFIYSRRNTPSFEVFVDLLGDFNKKWAPKAAILGLSIARKTFEKNNKPSPTHAYDTGAAWENLALEAYHRGLVVHGMEGFSYEKARKVLEIPEEYEILAMFAIGKKGKIEDLPEELQKQETLSERKKIDEFIMEGKYIKKSSSL